MVDSQSAVLSKPGGETVDTVNEPGWVLGGDEDRGPHTFQWPVGSALRWLTVGSEFRSEMSEATKASHEPRNRAVEQLKVKTRVKYFWEKNHEYMKNKNSNLESVRSSRHLATCRFPCASSADCPDCALLIRERPQVLVSPHPLLCIERGFLRHLVFLPHLTRFRPKE